jgi:hypothetical protein
LVEDNDGAPKCYGWNNPNNPPNTLPNNLQQCLHPYDVLGNATKPYENWDAGTQDWYWAGLYAVTPKFAKDNDLIIDQRPRLRAGRADPGGEAGKYPVVKKRSDPFAGYYVSTTGQVADYGYKPWDQKRYWNAAEVPYCVFADEWKTRQTGVDLGDFGLAIRNNSGTHSEFAFRDTGTTIKVGESSRKLCRTLVPTPDGQAVYNEDYVSFLVFPGLKSGAAGVRTEIAKLNDADNAEELALFFALDANLYRHKLWLKKFYAQKEFDPWPSYPEKVFNSIMRALKGRGFSGTGQFLLPPASVNYC